MPQRRNLLQLERSHHRHRAMVQVLQHDQTALITELSPTGTPDINPGNSSGLEPSNAVVSIPLVQNIRQVILNRPNRRTKAVAPSGFTVFMKPAVEYD